MILTSVPGAGGSSLPSVAAQSAPLRSISTATTPGRLRYLWALPCLTTEIWPPNSSATKILPMLADRQVGGAEESTGHEFDVPVARVHSVDLAAGAKTRIFRPAWQRGDVQVAVAAHLDVGRHRLELVRHTDHAVRQALRGRDLLSDLERLARQHGQSARSCHD